MPPFRYFDKKPKPHWLNDLTDAREAVLAAMRGIGTTADAADREATRLQPKYGFKGVGSADFDPFLKSRSLYELLSAIRKGATPEQAEKAAKVLAREVISNWNRNGSKSRVSVHANYELHRWEGAADTAIENATRTLLRAVERPLWNPCPNCEGMGRTKANAKCLRCKGTGVYPPLEGKA